MREHYINESSSESRTIRRQRANEFKQLIGNARNNAVNRFLPWLLSSWLSTSFEVLYKTASRLRKGRFKMKNMKMIVKDCGRQINIFIDYMFHSPGFHWTTC